MSRIETVKSLVNELSQAIAQGKQAGSKREAITKVMLEAIMTDDKQAIVYFQNEVKKKTEAGTEGSLFPARMCYTVAAYIAPLVLTGKHTLATDKALSTQYKELKDNEKAEAAKQAESMASLASEAIKARQAIEAHLADIGSPLSVTDFMLNATGEEQAEAMAEGKKILDKAEAEAEKAQRREALEQAVSTAKAVYEACLEEAPDLAMELSLYVSGKASLAA